MEGGDWRGTTVAQRERSQDLSIHMHTQRRGGELGKIEVKVQVGCCPSVVPPVEGTAPELLPASRLSLYLLDSPPRPLRMHMYRQVL